MKLKISLALAGTLAIAALSTLYLFGTAGAAQDTEQVIPRVNVDPTASLTITSPSNIIDFGSMPAGSTQTRTLALAVTANSGWQLTVSKNQDLKDPLSSHTINSGNFTFSSSGAAGPTYATSDTVFGTVAAPSNVVTAGVAIGGADVTVTYKLTVPSGQPVGTYSAAHTYTLIVE